RRYDIQPLRKPMVVKANNGELVPFAIQQRKVERAMRREQHSLDAPGPQDLQNAAGSHARLARPEHLDAITVLFGAALRRLEEGPRFGIHAPVIAASLLVYPGEGQARCGSAFG